MIYILFLKYVCMFVFVKILSFTLTLNSVAAIDIIVHNDFISQQQKVG